MIIQALPQASAATGWPCSRTNLSLGQNQPLQTTKYSFTRDSPVPLNCSPRRLGLLFVPRAADSTPPASASSASSDKTIVSDEGFSISKISFGDIGFAIGGSLLSNTFQVRNDVTRFCYGDEQHLDEALKRIFQYGLGGGISRRSGPILRIIREEVTVDGKYCLVLVFEAKSLQLSDFEQRQAKFESFFGPGIAAEIGKGKGNDLYEVRLISQTTPL